MQLIDIQAFTYEERHGLLPALTTTVSLSGAWILDRKTLSPNTLELRLEIQLRLIVDLYAAVIAAGVELTRESHQQLSALCTCGKHSSIDPAQVITVRLELTFLEDVTLHSLLMNGSAFA